MGDIKIKMTINFTFVETKSKRITIITCVWNSSIQHDFWNAFAITMNISACPDCVCSQIFHHDIAVHNTTWLWNVLAVSLLCLGGKGIWPYPKCVFTHISNIAQSLFFLSFFLNGAAVQDVYIVHISLKCFALKCGCRHQ